MGFFDKYDAVVEHTETIRFTGTVTRVRGLLIESKGPHAVIGELCLITIPSTGQMIPAEVVALHADRVQIMAFEDPGGIEIGSLVTATGETLTVPVSERLLGRVLNGLGKPIDGLGDIGSADIYPVINKPPDVLSRQPIREQLVTGVRAIDGMIPVGKGQRLGIFSGSGVGKSTLIGMIARNTRADVNVIALIGERGREVREFIEHDLGEEGLARSVIIVSTSDTPPLARLRGAYVATAVAEYFRDQGNDVMLLFDSVTRFARAQREIGLTSGEAPATRGYPPSVFSTLPRLLERCGNSATGTITGFYSILVEGDDMDEPVSDTVRGILDGHLSLSRRLAQRYHYPAIDVLASVSRLANKVTDRRHQKAAGLLRSHMAIYQEKEDLINVGAYAQGSDPEIDAAIQKTPRNRNYLTQAIDEKADPEETRTELLAISGLPDETRDDGAASGSEARSQDSAGRGSGGVGSGGSSDGTEPARSAQQDSSASQPSARSIAQVRAGLSQILGGGNSR